MFRKSIAVLISLSMVCAVINPLPVMAEDVLSVEEVYDEEIADIEEEDLYAVSDNIIESNENIMGTLNPSEVFARGSGTPEDPYLITSLSIFEKMGECSFYGRNNYVKLTCNLKLNGNCDPTLENKSRITGKNMLMPSVNFDGDGHTIENAAIAMNGYSSLLGSKVKNVTVKNAVLAVAEDTELTANSIDAGVIGWGGDLEDCKVEGTVHVVLNNFKTKSNGYDGKKNFSIGGVGYYSKGKDLSFDGDLKIWIPKEHEWLKSLSVAGIINNPNGDIESGHSYANISFLSEETGEEITDALPVSVGGVATGVGEKMTLKNCSYGHKDASKGECVISVGFVPDFGNHESNVAGIAVNNSGTIEKCANYGTIKAYNYVAGIVKTNGGSIINCTNEKSAKLILTNDGGKVAGIAVENIATSSGTGAVAKISNCVNNANISMGSSTEYDGYAAGIVYESRVSGKNNDAIISNCTNNGNISAKCASGIVSIVRSGASGRELIVENCTNNGDINGKYHEAGIVSYVGSLSSYDSSDCGVAPSIRYCTNFGTVGSPDNDAANWAHGGIAANVSFGEIVGCVNAGEVYGRDNVGGIVGLASYAVTDVSWRPIIRECYNLGTVTAKRIAGGIIGELSNADIKKCYNSGMVTGITVGGIAGIMNGEYYTDRDKTAGIAEAIEDSFNCGKIKYSGYCDGYRYYYYGGGIVGQLVFGDNERRNDMSLKNCYSIGDIETIEKLEYGQEFGGIIGRITENALSDETNEGTLKIENVYYKIQGDLDYRGHESYERWKNVDEKTFIYKSLSEEELLTQSSYVGFDFENTWQMGRKNYKYPILNGVGTEQLIYDYGIGGAKYAEYVIQVLDDTTGKPVGKPMVKFRDTTKLADRYGRVKFIASSDDLGDVEIKHIDYIDGVFEGAKAKPGLVTTFEIKRKPRVYFEAPRMIGNAPLKGGELPIEGIKSKSGLTGAGSTQKVEAINYPLSMKIKPDLAKKVVKHGEVLSGDTTSKTTSIPMEISIDPETGNLIVAIGVKWKGAHTVQDSYREAKRLMSKSGPFTEEPEEDCEPVFFKSVNYHEVNTYLMGYMTVDYTGEQVLITEGLIKMGISGLGSVTYRPGAFPGPGYGKVTLSGKGEIIGKAYYDEVFKSYLTQFQLALEESLTLAIGIGVDDAHIEAGGVGKSNQTITSAPADRMFDVNKDVTVTVALTPYVEGKLYVFETKAEGKTWDGQIWPREDASKNISASSNIKETLLGENKADDSSEDILGTVKLSGYELMDRESKVLTGAESIDVTESEAFHDGRPSLARLSDGTEIAAWIEDDKTKGDYDRTTLYYAVKEAGRDYFSPGKPVKETGRGDYYPSITAMGDSAAIIWLNADKNYAKSGEMASVDDINENSTVYLSIFNRKSNSFGEPMAVIKDRLSAPLYMSVATDGSSYAVTWAENSAGDMYMSEGQNDIYRVICNSDNVGKAELIAGNVSYLNDLDTAYSKGKYMLAYVADTDGNIETEDDERCFIFADEKLGRLKDDGRARYVHFSGDSLYYTKDAMIKRIGTDYASMTGGKSESLGIEATEDFSVLRGAKGNAIISKRTGDDFESYPVISYERAGAFIPYTSLYQSVEYGNLGDYSAIYNDDGSVELFGMHRMIDHTWGGISEESTNPFIEYSRRMSSYRQSDNVKIIGDVGYDVDNVKEGSENYFSFEVLNDSANPVENLTVEIQKDLDEAVQKEIKVNLGPCESKVISVPVKLDGLMGESSYGKLSYYNIRILGKNELGTYVTTGSAHVILGYSDLVMKDVDYVIDGDVLKVKGSVHNDGCDTISGKNKVILETAEGEKTLFETASSDDALKPGDKSDFLYEIPLADIGEYASVFDTKILKVIAEPSVESSKELRSDNNYSLLTIYRPLPESIELGEDKVGDATLVAGTITSIIPVVSPADALTEGMLYLSSNPNVVAVTDSGDIIAIREGTAVITVYSQDGSVSDSINVEVVGNVNEYDYDIDSNEVILKKGENCDLKISFELSADEKTVEPSDSFLVTSTDSLVANATFNGSVNWDDDKSGVVGNIKIDAVGPGVAYICISEGNVDEGGAAFVIPVTVSEQAPSYLAVEGDEYITLKVGEKYESKFSVLSDSTDPKIIYSSDEPKVAKVDQNGEITAESEGKTNIFARIINGEEVTEASITVEVIDPKNELYAVCFNSEGGSTIPSNIETQLLAYGEKVTFPDIPKKSGFIFGGWNSAEDGSGKTYIGNETIKAGITVTEDLFLHAVWIDEERAGGMWVAQIPEQTYNGSSIMPNVAVYDGARELVENVDYTVKYKNNIKAADKDSSKAPTVIVNGKGNYKGKVEIKFTILPLNIESGVGIDADDIVLKAKSSPQKINPVVTFDGEKLKVGKDILIEYPEGCSDGKVKNVGEYELTIKGKNGGNFTGERKLKVSVIDGDLPSTLKDIKKAKVTGLMKAYEYTGAPIIVTDGAKNPVKLTLNASGSITELKEDKDYTVRYRNNVGKGNATVIFTGIGEYKGILKKTFKISPYNISIDKGGLITVQDDISTVYLSSGAVPSVDVFFGGQKLAVGRDYTLKAKNNKKIATADSMNPPTVIITGKGRFSGKVTTAFSITKSDIGELFANAEDVVYKKGKACALPAIKVYDSKNNALKYGRDLDKNSLVYTYISVPSGYGLIPGTAPVNNTEIPAGSVIKVSVSATANSAYEGHVSQTFRVISADIKKASAALKKDVAYTGAPVYVSGNLDIKLSGKSLTEGVDYEIIPDSYRNNINKGKASVVIRGIGNYGGTKNVKYTIGSRDFAPKIMELINSLLRNS